MNRLLLIAAFGLITLVVPRGTPAAEPLQDTYRLMAHGEFEQAIETLQERLADTPEADEALRAETTFLLARANESIGNWDEAVRAYRIVTHEFADSECFANASLALAQLYVRQGQPEQAAAALEAAISSGLTPEHEFRARLYLAETISIPGTPVDDVDRALELFHALDEQAGKAADVARLNYGLGFCYQRKGNWEDAERAYVAAAEAAPDSLWAVYARMQRIAHYRQARLTQDADRLERLLRQHGMGPVALKLRQAEPRAPNLQRTDERTLEALLGQGREAQLPSNAVFAYGRYRVKADRFSVRSPDRVLIGRGNVSLVHNAEGARTRIRSTIVRIDLRRLHADFSGDVSFETTPKRPGAVPRKITNLQQLIINLRTGWFRVRSAESPE